MSGRIRVLYAEDNPVDVDLTRQVFDPLASEFELVVASTASDCRTLLQQRRCDVLLLDHHLPDQDGADLLRDLSRAGLQQPVVMITGIGDEDLVVRTLRLGASDYLPKRAGYAEQLPAVVRRVVTDARDRQFTRLRDAARPHHILYVEHIQTDIDLTVTALGDSAPQIEVRVARSYQDALRLLGTSNEIELVLIDLRVPPSNALDFLREAHLAGVRVPCVVITGRGDEETAVAAVKLGAYDYIVKRDNYLTQLPLVIENAIARHQLLERTAELQREITERTRAEADRLQLQHQLNQAQKLEGLGRLAGGIAHDFNNLLIVIRGYNELALNEIGDESPVREHLRQVDKASARAAVLTARLLAFARKQVFEPKVLDLNHLLLDMEPMLRRLLDEDIEFHVRLAPILRPILADPGQLEQVVVNLCVNARDAMSGGGRLTIETTTEQVDHETARGADLIPGEYVTLCVTDTGTGMTEDTRRHAFEPFFTTKPLGEGTGLGLSTCLGIVKQLGGHISLESESGRGTTVRIFMPQAARTEIAVATDALDAPGRGHETILLAEDEPLVREYAALVLASNGYTILEAGNGEEALRLAADHRQPIDLLLTDVVMPTMSGEALAAGLRGIRPRTKILFVSGYTDGRLGDGDSLAGVHYLQKPYTSASLARKVREILDGPAVA